MTTPTPPVRPKAIGLAPGLSEDAAGQDAAKYGTSNPVVQKLLASWMGKLHAVLGTPTGTCVDVGVGEGFALERMFPAGTEVVALEYRHDKAKVAAERLAAVQVVRGDAGVLPFPDASADLVTSIEVLEHLPTFEPAVAEMARICRGRLVVSVPWEPWFRLGNLGRGKNVKRLGNDPEHVQAFTPKRLERALGQHFEAVRVVRAFPWLIAEARTPRR
ncbi:class I SAM-dependent methyltransferase [Aquihabitans sp. G128]|uniref:class I SAM-dependent methyltransferase n=1 Tax=Aquihabitans sp. G128 TaxID=2849779 RepID=UPI001C241420|nr:class I SAM-dependent methyltransferase [Aquihabitans sp. G128]QXC62828.1 class I SAM-dependent methyltransferase [Aquihabitans sp. G128]